MSERPIATSYFQICLGPSVRTERVKAQGKGSDRTVFCEHGNRKSICEDCSGSAFCEHGKRKTQCKECGGGKSVHTERFSMFARTAVGQESVSTEG